MFTCTERAKNIGRTYAKEEKLSTSNVNRSVKYISPLHSIQFDYVHVGINVFFAFLCDLFAIIRVMYRKGI